MEIENSFIRLQILSRPQSDFDQLIINHDTRNINENDQWCLKAQNSVDFVEKSIKCLKKKVRFADDCGKILETIYAIENLSDISYNIISPIFGRQKSGTKLYDLFNQLSLEEEWSSSDDEKSHFYSKFEKTPSAWKIDFIQPASEYLKFRETLEKNKIALENVILRNDSGKMLGTIKVANLSFMKNVFLRFTSNAWKSYIDCPGTYESSYNKPYETFAFRTDIPKNEGEINKIEFCVCYIADSGVEHWDSNNGQNYSLISENSKSIPLQAAPIFLKTCDYDNENTINVEEWIHFNNLQDFVMKDYFL